MLYRKQGFPDESELVICTVTKILPHSVFVNLDEYDKTGMIHISEISPGRIRNIRDFVKEGKIIVCKVLGIDRERGHIDLSLRRVTENQRRNKVNDVKIEQKAEKIVEFISGRLKKDFRTLYGEISEKIFAKYPSLNSCFEDIAVNKASLENLGVQKELAEQLTEVIKQRIKPPEIEIKGVFSISTYAPNGVEIIRDALQTAEKIGRGKMAINYVGAGKYASVIKSGDYKSAEKILKEVIDKTESIIRKEKGTIEFIRAE